MSETPFKLWDLCGIAGALRLPACFNHWKPKGGKHSESQVLLHEQGDTANNHVPLDFAKENPEHNVDALLSQCPFIITEYLTEI